MKDFLYASFVLLLSSTLALAQDDTSIMGWMSAYKASGVTTFAATPKPKYGVHNEGNLERGYYYESGETSVQFYICPSGPVIPLEVSKITPEATDNCSVPGRPEPPISGFLSAKWKYDADKSEFIVSTTIATQSVVIPCKSAPMQMLVAAKFAQAKDYGVLADANDRHSIEIAKYLNLKVKNLKPDDTNDVPSERDCADAGDFWTYPIAESIANDMPKTLAITTFDLSSREK